MDFLKISESISALLSFPSVAVLLKSLENTGAWLSILSVVAGLLVSLLAARLSFRGKFSSLPGENADYEEVIRIEEIKDALKRQASIARWTGRSNGLLLFGQVIIGGILSTSFAHQEIDKKTIALLGVMVLASSLIRQQFRPDLKQRGARRREMRLRRLLREAEGGVYNLQCKIDGAEPVARLRKRLADRLSEIEQSEVEELPGEPQFPMHDVRPSPRIVNHPTLAAQQAVGANSAPPGSNT